MNTLELGVKCPDARLISDPRELAAFLSALSPRDRMAIDISGELSNTVLGDDLPNPLLLFRDGSIIDIERKSDFLLVRAEGSCHFDSIVKTLCDHGVPGLELLSGIPGTLGAAIVQNIAAYGQRLSDSFLLARAFDRRTRRVHEMDADAMGFLYRSSVLKDEGKYTPSLIVLEAALKFPVNGVVAPIQYEDVRALHSERNRALDDMPACRATVLEVRQRKGMVVSGDNWIPSAGSFFVSPVVPRETALELARLVRGSAFADTFLSWYQPAAGETRFPAALVMRAAGFLNGDRWGPVGLSPHHILALCRFSSATASDIHALSAVVKARVNAHFGISLKEEVRYLGEVGPTDLAAFLAGNEFQPGTAEPEWALGMGTPGALAPEIT